MRTLSAAALAVALLAGGCATRQDYIAYCPAPTAEGQETVEQCADRLANAENGRRAGLVALGTLAVVAGAAVGAASAPTYYVRPYPVYVPVRRW